MLHDVHIFFGRPSGGGPVLGCFAWPFRISPFAFVEAIAMHLGVSSRLS